MEPWDSQSSRIEDGGRWPLTKKNFVPPRLWTILYGLCFCQTISNKNCYNSSLFTLTKRVEQTSYAPRGSIIFLESNSNFINGTTYSNTIIFKLRFQTTSLCSHLADSPITHLQKKGQNFTKGSYLSNVLGVQKKKRRILNLLLKIIHGIIHLKRPDE